MSNKKFKMVSESDYEILKEIANKYSMTVEEFGTYISKKREKGIRHQIRFNDKELSIIDKRAGKLNMTRSEYCRRCYIKAIEEKLYMNMNIRELKEDTYGGKVARDIRVAISFDDAEQYKEMRRVSKMFSMQFSTLIRHFALTVTL